MLESSWGTYARTYLKKYTRIMKKKMWLGKSKPYDF